MFLFCFCPSSCSLTFWFNLFSFIRCVLRFHALHDNKIRSPSIKEFKEGYAFCNSVRSVIDGGKKKKKNKTSDNDDNTSIDIIIDVAGGHGALAALFLIMIPSATEAIVIDPANVGQHGVTKAWKKDFFPNKTLRYRYECLRTALPDELQRIQSLSSELSSPSQTSNASTSCTTSTTTKRLPNVLVVGCHACQHLSEEILHISCCNTQFHNIVHSVAVMPCCQKDHSSGQTWKNTSKNLNIPIAKVMDLLLAGKVMGSNSISGTAAAAAADSSTTTTRPSYYYDVRMKSIDATITPQNRIIICCRKARMEKEESSFLTGNPQQNSSNVNKAHDRLEHIYRKAHDTNKNICINGNSNSQNNKNKTCTISNSKGSNNHGSNQKRINDKHNNDIMKSSHLISTIVNNWKQRYDYVINETVNRDRFSGIYYTSIGFAAGLLTASIIGKYRNKRL